MVADDDDDDDDDDDVVEPLVPSDFLVDGATEAAATLGEDEFSMVACERFWPVPAPVPLTAAAAAADMAVNNVHACSDDADEEDEEDDEDPPFTTLGAKGTGGCRGAAINVDRHALNEEFVEPPMLLLLVVVVGDVWKRCGAPVPVVLVVGVVDGSDGKRPLAKPPIASPFAPNLPLAISFPPPPGKLLPPAVLLLLLPVPLCNLSRSSFSFMAARSTLLDTLRALMPYSALVRFTIAVASWLASDLEKP